MLALGFGYSPWKLKIWDKLNLIPQIIIRSCIVLIIYLLTNHGTLSFKIKLIHDEAGGKGFAGFMIYTNKRFEGFFQCDVIGKVIELGKR